LRIDFATEAAFRGEYVSNIANGGVFVETNAGFSVREPVRVDLVLQWCGDAISLDGEIVHVVPAEAAGSGGRAGVAIQFSLRASDLRARFEPVLARMAADDARVSGPGNRVARRARVRVPIVVRTTDGRELEGRSRDLSTTGALVEVGGDPVATGEVVQLAIANPTTAQEVDLHGTVMRTVRGPGPRVALGVRFEIPPSEIDAVGSFLRELQVSEQSRRLGGITGPIAEIGIENVLQMFGTCSLQGTLSLAHGDEEAVVVFEAGMLRGVQLGDAFGRKALARLLAWRTGTFEFNARPSPALYRGEPMPLDAAVLDALRLLDESRAADPGAFPATARLRVDREKLAVAGAELSQAEEAILDLAAVGMSVGKVIDVIPEPDEEIRQQLGRLVERGLIELVE
jgi:Tfp pilus assembly protein PilZ